MSDKRQKSLTKEQKEELDDLFTAKLVEHGVGLKGKKALFRNKLRELDGRPFEEIKKEIETLVEHQIVLHAVRHPKIVAAPAEIVREEFSDEILEKAHKVLERDTKEILGFMFEPLEKLHAGDKTLIIFIYVSNLSLIDEENKTHLWIIGKSGKGKSHVIYAVLTLFPDDTYEVFTSASPLFIHYFINEYGEDVFKNKILFIDEAEASKDTLPILRAFTGQTPIPPRHGTVKEQKLLDIKTKNRPSVNFNSIHAYGTDQIKNRFLFTNPDESGEQDIAVYELQQTLRGKSKRIDEGTKEQLKLRRAITRIIIDETKDLDVIIPWSIKNWPYTDKRFLFPMFLTFVKNITRIGFKRRRKGDMLIAERADIGVAGKLWKIYHKTIRYRVRDSSWEIYKLLERDSVYAPGDAEMQRTTHAWLAEETGLSSVRVGKLCEELLWENLVGRVKAQASSDGGPRPWVYWAKEIQTLKDMKIERDDSVVI